LLQLRLDDSKLLPAFSPEVLLPEGITGLVQQVLAWPGMSALLGWVSGGHFLGGLGPDDLGRALLDVQVSKPLQHVAGPHCSHASTRYTSLNCRMIWCC
jgi:hypothetical protein